MFSKNQIAMFLAVAGFLIVFFETPSSRAQAILPRNLETCFSPAEPCDQKLIAFINSAQKTLDVAIYALTHPGIADAFIRAHERGVEVRLVVDRTQSKGNKSLVGLILKAGVPLKIGRFKGVMHNKFTIVDGMMIETGSYNYTSNATNANAENQIYSNDENVVGKYGEYFESLWNNGLTF